LVVSGLQFTEEVEDLVQDLVGTTLLAIHLVDHDHRFEIQLQRFLQNEAGLRHGPLEGVDQQQHAVGHLEHPLHLTTEIRVPGGVDQVDAHPLIGDREVLGGDGDAAFAFEIVRVHDPLTDILPFAKNVALPQDLVDQRGLAVVHVGNDGDVADLHGHPR
jgi:hypothetical protein